MEFKEIDLTDELKACVLSFGFRFGYIPNINLSHAPSVVYSENDVFVTIGLQEFMSFLVKGFNTLAYSHRSFVVQVVSEMVQQCGVDLLKGD